MARWGSPALLRWLVERVPSADVQSFRAMVDLMDATSHEVLRSKRGGPAVPEKVGGGKDIMSILRAWPLIKFKLWVQLSFSTYFLPLVKANKEAVEEDRLTDAELVGQVT